MNVRGMLKRKKLPGAQQSLNMMGPGGGMMEGMKNNMMFMFSNMLMIGWISYFFSGFVLGEARVPMHSSCVCVRGTCLAC